MDFLVSAMIKGRVNPNISDKIHIIRL